MRKALVISLLCLAVIMTVSGAFAEEAKPCAGDITKFCGNVPQGEGRIVGCLKQNGPQLSPGCQSYLVQLKEAMKEADQACEEDIMTYCAGVQPGEGRIMQCLKANKSHLSFKCKRKLHKVKKEMD